MTVYIYALTDPRTQEVRYVGKTNNLHARLRHHIWEGKAWREGRFKRRKNDNVRRIRWISELLELNLRPTLDVLEECSDSGWEEVERYFIRRFRDIGIQLFNITEGGDGVSVPYTPERRMKVGAAHKGKRVSEEVKTRLREVNLARHDAGCKNGHPWTSENLRYRTGTKADGSRRTMRRCRQCDWERVQRKKDDSALQLAQQQGPVNYRATCKRGHPWTPENTSWQGGRPGAPARTCRTCKRMRSNAYYRKSHPKLPEPITCRHGHPRNEENTVIKWNGISMVKRCRLCVREYARTSAKRQRENKHSIGIQLALPITHGV